MAPSVGVGIVGGGLMGREAAVAFARWFALDRFPVRPELVAVCDVSTDVLDWFRQIPSVRLLTTELGQLLAREDVDVVYVAVPHHLHEEVYLAVLRAGKDLMAEKPFGIDLGAARRVRAEAASRGRFLRVSSEFPFWAGAQRAYDSARSGELGTIIGVRTGLLHSSDMDPAKPINWKRQARFCGEPGVMGDLGLHVAHLPLRLGWKPSLVYSQLQKIYPTRPDGKGGRAACDTWDNAVLHCTSHIGGLDVPVMLEMKRMAPGDSNTWYLEILGTEMGVRYSTKEPKTLWKYRRADGQSWSRSDLPFGGPFRTVTPGIFETGMLDTLQQMWAAFFAERAGQLGGLFGCATAEEAVASQELWAAALASHSSKAAVALP
jgi:predicted dehydrogenase